MLVLINGNNTESWAEIDENKILALSYCPENSPSTSETKFTREEALDELETLLETGWTIKENDIFTEAEIKRNKGGIMAKPIKKERPKITYAQRGEFKRVIYSYSFYIEEGEDSKLKTHNVEIIFQDDEFNEAKFDFRGGYNREEWRIMAMIDNIITKIEKSIAKEQGKLAGDPA